MNSKDFESILQLEPGNPVFVEYADQLRSNGDLSKSLLICLKGISSNPSLHIGRLLLARIFYQLNCVPFALEQLLIIRREIPENATLNKLIDKLGGVSSIKQPEKTQHEVAAEADFDIGDLEAIEDAIK